VFVWRGGGGVGFGGVWVLGWGGWCGVGLGGVFLTSPIGVDLMKPFTKW